MTNLKTYSFEEGKYEIIRDTASGEITAVKRHGEDWFIQFEALRFSKFFHAMLNHIDFLENCLDE